MLEFGELTKQVKTRIDLATVLAGGTIGFILDAGLDVVSFLTPGIFGTTCASGALVVKIIGEEIFLKNRTKRKLLKKCDALLKITKASEIKNKNKIIKKLQAERSFFTEEVTTEAEFNSVLNQVLKDNFRETA